MALKKKKKKPKKPLVEFTLYGVMFSYPTLDEAREFRGKKYFQVDAIIPKDHPQIRELKVAIRNVATQAWGEDKAEWPEKIQGLMDGDEREDQKGYKGKYFLSLKTTFRPDVLTMKGGEFDAASVKGGMYGNVAFNITTWVMEDGDEGLSLFLAAVQIDTKKKAENLGGGTPAADRFKKKRRDDDDDDQDEDDSDDQDDEDDEDDQPRGRRKKKRPSRDFDDDEDDDEEEEDEDDEEEAPPRRKKKRRPSRDFDDDED